MAESDYQTALRLQQKYEEEEKSRINLVKSDEQLARILQEECDQENATVTNQYGDGPEFHKHMDRVNKETGRNIYHTENNSKKEADTVRNVKKIQPDTQKELPVDNQPSTSSSVINTDSDHRMNDFLLARKLIKDGSHKKRPLNCKEVGNQTKITKIDVSTQSDVIEFVNCPVFKNDLDNYSDVIDLTTDDFSPVGVDEMFNKKPIVVDDDNNNNVVDNGE